MDGQELASAFLVFKDRLEKLAARSLNPVLSGRFSPEDVVQETMAAVSRDSSDFLSNQNLPVYFRLRMALLQTIRQIERRHLAAGRRDAYREVPVHGEDERSVPGIRLESIPDTATSPLTRLARQDRDALLRAALARLHDNDRAILELRHEEGLGNAECAVLLGIGEKAASLRYVRALQRLRKELDAYSEFRS